MNTYTTISGDMWDQVALKTMGSETYMNLLIQANPEHRTIRFFPAGIVLVIPDAPQQSEAAPPPWLEGQI